MIGVISDTHGLLRPEAVQALRGCESIIHAGDVGELELLDWLREIAPVVAIRGNIDEGPEFAGLPAHEIVTVAATRIYVLHDIGQLQFDPVAAGFSAVISGHSHKPRIERRNGVLFLNPGAAGPRRFKLPTTVAHLRVEAGQLQAQIVDLLGQGRVLLPPSAPPARGGRTS